MAQSFHEDFTMRAVAPGSDRSFGLVFAGVFAVIGMLPLLRSGEPRLWSLGLAVAFVLVALTVPRALRRMNLLWFRFGFLLSTVMIPVVMGILFFVLLTSEQTYWIERPASTDRDSLKHQF
jgi:hypothetical protein